MSIADYDSTRSDVVPHVPTTGSSEESRPLHRIREVREQQGVSERRAARALGSDVRKVRQQEDPTVDMSLSDLYRWQQLLEVPVANLLVDLDAPLSVPILKRAQLLRLMKTVGSIMENSENIQIQRLSQMMVEQLVEIMPELKDVSPWHDIGQRRSTDEMGRVAERRLPDDLFVEFDP